MTDDASLSSATRPRRRRSWTVGPAILIAVAILVVVKSTSLNGLPDIGDPFDIEAFSRPIPDETNAFVLYRRAFERLGKEPDTGPVWTADWRSASPAQRRWLDESREALGIWKRGTARPDALYIPPRTLNVGTLLPVIQGMRSFGRLAVLEATRLEDEGDLGGALDWYLAVIRSGRHCGRRGVLIERLVGIALGSMASGRLSALAARPEVDGKMLRRALDAVIEADAMTAPPSDSFKCEYIAFLNTIVDPTYEDPAKLVSLWGGKAPWSWSSSGPGRAFSRAERSIKREPERSRRVYRLIFSNWLAYCNRPSSGRPPFATLAPPAVPNPLGSPPGFELFVPEPAASGSVKALPPEELARWFHTTIYAEVMSPNFAAVDRAFRRDRSTFASLLVTLANELHKREKGEYPEKAESLVGPYLKALPEGYVPVDGEAKKTHQGGR